MSALKDALKSSPTTTGNSSSKNPAFYNRMKNQFIVDMATAEDASIRVTVAGNNHVPANTLKQMLETESDVQVLRAVLMNPRTPLKAITNCEQAEQFADDEQVIAHLKARVNSASASDTDDINVAD